MCICAIIFSKSRLVIHIDLVIPVPVNLYRQKHANICHWHQRIQGFHTWGVWTRVDSFNIEGDRKGTMGKLNHCHFPTWVLVKIFLVYRSVSYPLLLSDSDFIYHRIYPKNIKYRDNYCSPSRSTPHWDALAPLIKGIFRDHSRDNASYCCSSVFGG